MIQETELRESRSHLEEVKDLPKLLLHVYMEKHSRWVGF